MKRIALFILLALMLCKTYAQNTFFSTEGLQVAVNEEGFFTSIQVCDKEILSSNKYPIVLACVNDRLVLPTRFVPAYGTLYEVGFDDGGAVLLDVQQFDNYLKITLEQQENVSYDAFLLCPVKVSLCETVGDIIGVVQGKNLAFGIQALNIKTNAGIPQEYVGKVHEHFNYAGEDAAVSTSKIFSGQLAATRVENGVMMQFSARYRGRQEYRKVQGVEQCLVEPVQDDDRLLEGASVALFGCRKSEALSRIGDIEVAENLPHPMFDGEWGKTSRAAMKPYIISDFSENDLDFVLEKCHRAGMEYLYHIEPFAHWGHFDWSPEFVKGDDKAVAQLVARAEKEGVKMGVHTLSNFMTTDDSYVTPLPSKHLLKQGVVKLQTDITADQTDFAVYNSPLFSRPMTINVLQIGDELISYRTAELSGDIQVLHSCTRGVYGTKKSAHSKNETVYKLWDHPYKTLFPDLELQDAFADRIIEIFNNTGLSQISFDGLEGCSYTGQDNYAVSRFVSRCYEGWDHNVMNDASQLNHYNWHIHSRMNWGEPWGEAMRTGQVEARIKNQDFFRRNLFPRMLGWFKISLADRKYECTTLEDVEWAMSEAAGFDAGYGMTIYMNAMRNHGQLDDLLDAMKNWDALRLADAFSEAQKQRLKDPYTEWHLEKSDDSTFLLYEMHISRRFRCDFNDMQPGQPHGADWQWNTPFEGGFALRIHVEGKGSVTNPCLRTADDVLMFSCTLKSGQYLLFDFNGKAIVTDKNYNFIASVEPQGTATLPQGDSAVSFSCESVKGEDDELPEISVRFMTRDLPEKIGLTSYGKAF